LPAHNELVIHELAYRNGDEWKMQESNIIPVRTNEHDQRIVLQSKNSYFMSTDGSTGGFQQLVTLRRSAADMR
jgi:hypothetical protein